MFGISRRETYFRAWAIVISNESAERRREADEAAALIEPMRESVVYVEKKSSSAPEKI